jgi:uncharacterized protein YbbC (DUF1343 family)
MRWQYIARCSPRTIKRLSDALEGSPGRAAGRDTGRGIIVKLLKRSRVWLSIFCILAVSAPELFRAQTKTTAGETLTGLDVLEAENFAPLAGKRIGLITNQTGRDRAGHSTIDLLAHAPNVKLVALFSPEHGIRGTEDEKIPSSSDPQTALPIYSLYGETTRPTDQMLAGIDTLVFDIQDAGVRFFTYITTMGYAMEAAAQHHIAFYVLDRPDPLGGVSVEGPMLDRDKRSFVGYFPMPLQPGMTLGEMARMFNAENHLHCNLHVIAMKNWNRAEQFDRTGLPWVNPSPNLRSFKEELLYPSLEILQAGGVSVGRGTDKPFEQIGAPWIHADELAANLNQGTHYNVEFSPVHFTPQSGLYAGQLCEGVEITSESLYEFGGEVQGGSVSLGLELAATLSKLYPAHFDVAKMIFLVGNAETIARLTRGDPPAEIIAGWSKDLEAFRRIRAKYLLYR